jgi:DNA-directed RNA polymerase delta subunit
MAKVRRSKIDTLVEQITDLSRKELAELRRRISEFHQELSQDEVPHSIMELEGLGKEFWRSIDVEEYLSQERDSWSS